MDLGHLERFHQLTKSLDHIQYTQGLEKDLGEYKSHFYLIIEKVVDKHFFDADGFLRISYCWIELVTNLV